MIEEQNDKPFANPELWAFHHRCETLGLGAKASVDAELAPCDSSESGSVKLVHSGAVLNVVFILVELTDISTPNLPRFFGAFFFR